MKKFDRYEIRKVKAAEEENSAFNLLVNSQASPREEKLRYGKKEVIPPGPDRPRKGSQAQGQGLGTPRGSKRFQGPPGARNDVSSEQVQEALAAWALHGDVGPEGQKMMRVLLQKIGVTTVFRMIEEFVSRPGEFHKFWDADFPTPGDVLYNIEEVQYVREARETLFDYLDSCLHIELQTPESLGKMDDFFREYLERSRPRRAKEIRAAAIALLESLLETATEHRSRLEAELEQLQTPPEFVPAATLLSQQLEADRLPCPPLADPEIVQANRFLELHGHLPRQKEEASAGGYALHADSRSVLASLGIPDPAPSTLGDSDLLREDR
jgi:hypothetical protein